MGRLLYLGALIVACIAGGAWLAAVSAPFALAGDNESLSHPLLVDAWRQLMAGTPPIRTVGRWGGSPLAGDTVAGALYPLYLPGYALTSFPHARALDVAVVLHLIVLTVGLVWWLRGLRVSATTALAGALLIATTPTLLFAARGWIQYWAALAWWPWLWGACARLAARPATGAALVAASALALQVYAGYPQFALYAGVVGMGWLLAAPGAPRGRRAALALAIGVGALGLAAPSLLAGIPTAANSIRSGPGGQAMLATLDVFRLAPAAWPEVLRATPLTLLAPFRLAPCVLLLAIAGAFRLRFANAYLGVSALAAIALAAGGPLFRWLHDVPPFSFFAGPVKLFYLAAVLVGGLAVLGLERLRVATAAVQRVALATLAATLAATSPALGGIALVTIVLPARLLGGSLALLALASAAAFLASTQALVAPHLVTAGRFTPLLHEPPAAFAIDAAAGRWVALDVSPRLRQVGMNFGALWGVPAWSGVGPLVPWRQHAVLEDADPDAATAVVDQIGAAGVIVGAGSALETTFERAGFVAAPPHAGLRALRRAAPPPPRFVLVAHAVVRDDPIEAARAGRGLTRDAVVLETSEAAVLADGDPHGTLAVREESPDGARLHVRVDRPTWLVARDPGHPSWEATVDGAPVPLVPAAGFLHALHVPAGDHEVALAYHERGLAWGAVTLVMTLLALPLVLRALTSR